MKKHTTYYVIGAVLIGVGAYLYGTNKNKNNVTVNLNPPAEVKEGTPDLETPPYVSYFDSIKKFIDSLTLTNKENTSTTTNQIV